MSVSTADVTRHDLGEPFRLFDSWFKEAEAKEPNDANAMGLATVGPDGMPSLRIVLLKGVDERGFVFYTNYESRKGQQLMAHRKAALTFHWKSLRRSVRIEGDVELTTPEEADAYFASRPRSSQIGAWASDQSHPLPDRATLERRFADLSRHYAAEKSVPRPAYWSGFRVAPERIEFWQERPFRLHDRVLFTREGEAWRKQRLFP
jgi:pyridoxamine 5'-phosphate oxidase